MVHNMQLITHNSLSPIFSARCNINARAASYSLGMMPSKMASLMALFKAPTCWQGERPKRLHDFFTTDRRLEITDTVAFLQILQLLAYQLKLLRKRFLRSIFLEVMSASHSVIRSSISSPASNKRRRTAESVTTSSAITMGRMCRLTIFCTYFIFSFIGSFILRKISGIIFSPMKLWLWNVQPARGFPTLGGRLGYIMQKSCPA